RRDKRKRMQTRHAILLAALATLAAGGRAAAAPSFTQDVQPFLAKYCADCHGGSKPKAGVNLEYKGLLSGGRRKMVVPGKPDDSPLVRVLEGTAKQMPPRRYTNQPTAKEIALVREWIASGAKEEADKPAEKPAEKQADAPAKDTPKAPAV